MKKVQHCQSLRRANEKAWRVMAAGMVLLALTACDTLGIPDFLAPDQVPQAARDQPRMVASPLPQSGSELWPRLGDVPSKPKDFSPKPVNDHYMDELATDRADAQEVKQHIMDIDNPHIAEELQAPHFMK